MRVWLGWWLPLTGLWMLLVFTTAGAELVAGAFAAALGAGAAVLVRSVEGPPAALRPRWLLRILSLPRAVLVETLWLVPLVARAVVRREPVSGRLRVVEFPGARSRTPQATGRRAFAKWLGSVSPNAIVIGFAEDDDAVLIHQLVHTAAPPSCDPEAP